MKRVTNKTHLIPKARAMLRIGKESNTLRGSYEMSRPKSRPGDYLVNFKEKST
jgi:hypothetical protein